MPELPEVEITKRKLEPLILGKRILNLGGKKILKIERRGKAVLIHLSGGKILGFHQRMSGKLLFMARDFSDKHVRKRFKLSDGHDLVFHDVRKFGVVWYGDAEKVLSDNYFKTLGPDALAISFQEFKNILAERQNLPPTPSFVRRGSKKNNSLPPYEGGRAGVGGIKSFLLNQKNLAGIGNIMADEILWYSKINPEKEIKKLSSIEIKKLHQSIKFILNRSIKLGGSTMRDWFHPEGETGGYFKKRFIYGKEDKKCFRCGNKIIRKKIAGRSSYYCAKCQS